MRGFRDAESSSLRKKNLSNHLIGWSQVTHMMLAKTSPRKHAFTQSTAHSVLSSSSSEGSGGSSLA